MLFKKINESKRNPKTIRVDKYSQFYNRSMKYVLQNNGIEMLSKYNEGKPVVAERFIKTLKTKFINKRLQLQKKCILMN